MRFLNQRLFRTSTPPRKSVAQFKCGASNGLKISAPSNLGAVLANPSLNRTFCGTPALGFISFSPNTGVPQNAG